LPPALARYYYCGDCVKKYRRHLVVAEMASTYSGTPQGAAIAGIKMSGLSVGFEAYGDLRGMLSAGKFGRHDARELEISPRVRDADGLWYLGISSPGNGADLLSLGDAIRIATAVRAVGAGALAARLEAGVAKAERDSR
jgi:hypothetical protein